MRSLRRRSRNTPQRILARLEYDSGLFFNATSRYSGEMHRGPQLTLPPQLAKLEQSQRQVL